MNKGFKIYLGLTACILLVLLIFVLCYMSNPLVKKGHIGMIEYIIICYKSLTAGGDDIHAIADFAFCKSEKDPGLEKYAVSLYEKSANRGYAPSQYKMGGLNLYLLNNEKKAEDWLNKAISQNYDDARYLLGIYYIQTQKNEDKGLELLKEADKNKFKKASDLYEKMGFGIDYNKIEKAYNQEKENILNKKYRSDNELSVF